MSETPPPNDATGKPADTATQLATVRTDLAEQRTTMAFERTRFAGDRTLMAWMRTAVSLFGFGFTIYKFFEYLYRAGLTEPDWRPRAPRVLAILLIGLGLVFLLVAVVQYIGFLKRLSGASRRRFPISSTLIAAVFLWVLGLLALITTIFQAGPV